MWEVHVVYCAIILLCIAVVFVMFIKFHNKDLTISYLRSESDAWHTQLMQIERELNNLRMEQITHLRERLYNQLEPNKKRNLLIDLYDSCIIRNDFKETKRLLNSVAEIKNSTIKNKPNVGG